jgi:hypothetical protein
MRAIGLVLMVSVLMAARPAAALCMYGGELYAKTTVAREFRDSRLVVRARVVVADNHWSDIDESWTAYTVHVLHYFKGIGPARLRVFTMRDSGGFYMDNGPNPDLEGEYLLFLNPWRGEPTAAHGAMEVNYNCGQSGPWTKVSLGDREALARLSHRPPRNR